MDFRKVFEGFRLLNQEGARGVDGRMGPFYSGLGQKRENKTSGMSPKFIKDLELCWIGAIRKAGELPGKDSNLHKESQNLLCYRYTTGYRSEFSLGQGLV